MAQSDVLGKGSRFVVLASVCIVVAALYFAQEVFIPLALALLFTFVCSPLVSRLERFHLPRTLSVIIVVGLGLCFVIFLTYQLVTQIADVADQLPHYKDEIRSKVDKIRGSGKVQKRIENLENAIMPTTSPTTAPAATNANQAFAPAPPGQSYTPDHPLPVREYDPTTPVKTALEWLGSAMHPLATAFLVVVFVIFMLFQREDLRDRMIRLLGAGRINATTQAVSDAADRISKYLLSLALVNLCYGICVAFGLWIIGKALGDGHAFPNALLWGLICGLSRFIPYIGTWIAAAVPMALSFGLFPGYGVFIATICMFLAYEIIVAQFIEPHFYGARTGLSAIAVLASAVFWGWLWGPVGLLLSTPLTVILVVIGKHVPQLQFLDIILGDEPVLEPPARIYQRLLAMDAEEAADLAREYLKERTLDQVFGEILLPALKFAEVDHHRGRLDAEQQKFVRQTIRELVSELADLSREQAKKKAADDAARLKQPDPSTEEGTAPGNGALPQGCTVNIVCLPSHDESDEIAGLMLTELLADRGYCAYTVSQEKLASEMMDAVEKKEAHVVVISALPPAAVTHARYLCKRLHARFAEVSMVVGLWTVEGDLAKAKDRISCDQAVTVTSSFSDALHQIQQLSQPVLVSAA